jgi:hypothetical protein
MEITKPEVAAISAVSLESLDQLQVLHELELSLVGGGQGEVTFG